MVEIQGRFKRIESAFNVAAARVHPPCDNSSGSDHSPDLSDLVASFIEKEGQIVLREEEETSSDDNNLEDVNERLRKLLEGLSCGEERMRILSATMEVAGTFVGDISSSKRHLMAFLRNKGFDAGLCKSSWERFGKNTGGKYEYVDVRCGGDYNNRYFVETNLAGEFEIARPTKRYLSILSQVPRVFVGTSEELKLLVRIMCHEMRRSMKHVGIHVPPWRRNGYMQAKWFGFYKRTSTTNNYEMVNTYDTTAFKGCKEEFWEAKGLKVMVGQLSIAFNISAVEV
ncbi:hypothetical protein AtNW77_Chr1g0062121 [Arabidopsis thaliana]|jgi:uncharacterized protein (TIGR01615 family)|uniref:DUF506 family protein (DUF506) n=4 Tax=Arabidopsis TaxID=3701 RepID=O48807_ARATH|nr:DUF506 family protein (DUF506) [Arabidopsis thaliana]KAG7650308.1 PDDEXK-like [Arabidopsis thaliana x Arabidopsis arenosa]AAF70846.1 F2401.16 [Arabidopsis thaliana]AEE33966.1 DUF506 family protein (DUF506) [Arabidopsis thaliana]OAP16015.1 hypothetical protein AXX17_AT1G55720 [Arabidopsis thaliana]CAA0309628.1 unnamed protein product [Arabidopsis thaliana]|eukprot:NP_176432.2 DUF506 family protein (DUF506) [Arabidopsis thaliana]